MLVCEYPVGRCGRKCNGSRECTIPNDEEGCGMYLYMLLSRNVLLVLPLSVKVFSGYFILKYSLLQTHMQSTLHKNYCLLL